MCQWGPVVQFLHSAYIRFPIRFIVLVDVEVVVVIVDRWQLVVAD